MTFDDRTIGEGTITRGRELGGGRTTLVIYYDDSTEVVALEEGVPQTIGRSKPADIVVPEKKLSRAHARFTATESGVKCEDLESTNGTHHKGKRIREVMLSAGDSVTMGRVTISVNRAEARANLLGDFVTYLDFVERLRQEVVRTRTFRRGVTVMFVRTADPNAHVSIWGPVVRGMLRPVDRVALYGDHALFALIPETDEDRAKVVADKIVELAEHLMVGVALHGSRAAELIDAARRAGRIADAESRVVVASHDVLATAGEALFADRKMIELEELLERVSRSKIPALLLGETGVGKEVVAQAIHRRGPRAEGPMLAVNCGAMAASHVLNVLFGHEAGAFDGATEQRPGLLEMTAGGTLFLDEVAELSSAAQAALLRVLETMTFRRIGGSEDIDVDARLLTATNRDLRKMVEEGAFRRDLFHRLNAITLELPPLRERPGDLDPLIDRFLSEASVAGGARVTGIEDDARALLHRYEWPGNVRELRNAIERAVVSATEARITTKDLPGELRPQPVADPDAAPVGSIDLRAKVKAYEQDLIADALEKAAGDGETAAKLLSIPLKTLRRKVDSHGLSDRLES